MSLKLLTVMSSQTDANKHVFTFDDVSTESEINSDTITL
jgi:hypothetical protein